MAKPILCLDFDGVIHSYDSGWKSIDVVADTVTNGFFDWLETARDVFDVVVYSSRSSYIDGLTAMEAWFRKEYHAHYAATFNDFADVGIRFAHEKPAAFLTIDDRALCFSGRWNDYDPVTLLRFLPWNKRTKF
jgi:hypothetical protein